MARTLASCSCRPVMEEGEMLPYVKVTPAFFNWCTTFLVTKLQQIRPLNVSRWR